MHRCAIGVLLAAVAFVGGRSALSGSEQQLSQSEALQSMRDAVNNADARRYASVYSTSATITIFGTTVLRGRAAIEKHEVDLLAQFPNARFEFLEMWLDDDHRRAVARYGINAETASKLSMGHEGLLFFTFNAAGEIEREHRYLDSLTPMAQLGLLGNTPRRPVPELARVPTVSHRPPAGRHPIPAAPPRERWAAVVEHRRAEISARLSGEVSVDELMLAERLDGLPGSQRWLDAIGAFEDPTFDVTNALDFGSDVIVEGILHARVSRPFGVIQPSASRVAVHRAVIVSYDANGRIKGIRAFMNGRELAEAAGQWPLR